MDVTCSVALEGKLNFAWSDSQKITVFQKSEKSSSSIHNETLYELQYFASAKKNVFLQRLIRSSYDIFRVSQVCRDASDLIRLSHQYRAVLAMCHQEIYEFLSVYNSMPSEKFASFSADADLVKAYDLLWHLAEVVLFQNLDPGKLVSALTEWYFVQSQEAINLARNLLGKSESTEILSKESSDASQLFWSTALALLTQARSIELSALLASHSRANSHLLRDIRQLLIAMPIEESSSIDSANNWPSSSSFEKMWHHWQNVCNVRLIEVLRDYPQSKDMDVEYSILILSILAGRHDCWNDPRVVDVCGTWYFQFVAWLFYTQHFVDTSSLCGALEQFKSKFGIDSDEPSESHSLSAIVDQVIKHIFTEDILSMVFTLSEKFNNWWMVAHFSNLVKHLLPDLFLNTYSAQSSPERLSLKLENFENSEKTSKMMSFASTMPDFFLMRYAESLAADPTLLSIALGYLDYCTTLQSAARAVQVSLIQRTKPTTTRLTHNLIQLAKRHHLPEVIHEIARVKARSSLSLSPSTFCIPDIGGTCSALGWAIVAQDIQLIAHIITRVLTHSISNESIVGGAWNAVKEVANIVLCLFGSGDPGTSQPTRSWFTPLIASPEFAFISRYAEFQCRLLDADDAGAIIRTALDLLSTSDSGGFHVPIKFRIHLLGQLKPHLNPAIMNRKEIEALDAIVAELKAILRLIGKRNENVESLLMSSGAVLVQARAAAALRGANCPGGRHSPSQQTSEYAVSDTGRAAN